eukprot:COSAG04_NODE_2852_length_3486_cov_1.350162_2_plen_106_part_00
MANRRLAALRRQLAPPEPTSALPSRKHTPLTPPLPRASPTVGGIRNGPELHGLSATERYFFEVNGYLGESAGGRASGRGSAAALPTCSLSAATSPPPVSASPRPV